VFQTIKSAEDVAADAAAVAAVERIRVLRRLLLDSDYVALADYDRAKPDVIVARAGWRAELRGLLELYPGE
jgi:hypothetical protein